MNHLQTYHCRLRRRHVELDFDGGNSIEILKRFLTDEDPSQKSGTPIGKGAPASSTGTPATPQEKTTTPNEAFASPSAATSPASKGATIDAGENIKCSDDSDM